MLGLYIHVPFCDGKCPYCDFYSSRGSEAQMDAYVFAIERSLFDWGKRLSAPEVDTVYFGGGTPSLLGAKRLSTLLAAAKEAFRVAGDAEITVECNPRSSSGDFFARLREKGFNRLSVGVQSFCEEELVTLGRRHTSADGLSTLVAAREAGFDNVSLDLMINLPGQTMDSLSRSLEIAVNAAPRHISVYMLKNESGTAFANLPPMEETQAAEQYMFVCERLAAAGYAQYEISNFALPGFESRHNRKYWQTEAYLGLGPAAHSFLNGRRFYYPRDIAAFLRGGDPVDDGPGGDEKERLMLGLRLTKGVEVTPDLLERSRRFVKVGLMQVENGRLSFTREGFLVSNTVLAALL